MGRLLVFRRDSALMAGKKGCSGGYRPGAGRPTGATAIKKTGKATTKKQKAVDAEPSTASVKFLSAFVKQATAAAELAAAQTVCSFPFDAMSRAARPVLCRLLSFP